MKTAIILNFGTERPLNLCLEAGHFRIVAEPAPLCVLSTKARQGMIILP